MCAPIGQMFAITVFHDCYTSLDILKNKCLLGDVIALKRVSMKFKSKFNVVFLFCFVLFFSIALSDVDKPLFQELEHRTLLFGVIQG